MIVPETLATGIVSGRVTRYRLPRSSAPPEPGSSVAIGVRRDNPALGYTRAGTPRQETVRVARVRVDSVELSIPERAIPSDARAEGHADVDALLEAWPVSDPTWVVAFTVDPTAPTRLLAREIVAGRQGAYTEVRARALTDEPEAVDVFTLDRFTAQARERDRERTLERRRRRRELPFEEQVAALMREARERHVDVRDEARAIRRWTNPTARRRQLESMRRKLEQRAA